MSVNYSEINQQALDLLLSTKKHLNLIDPKIKALIEIRVSQINGCAYCVDLHTTEARKLGEDQQKLDCLSVWKESSLFSSHEMAALNWAECVTNISLVSNSNKELEVLLKYFTEAEVVDLTFVVSIMNGLNRLAISLGDKPSKRSV